MNGNITGTTPGVNQVHGSVNFVTDAPQVAICTTYTQPVIITIDDVPLCQGTIPIGTGTGFGGMTLDFTGAGAYARKQRRYKVEFPAGYPFEGLYIGQSDTVWPAYDASPIRAVSEGDSYFVGGSSFPTIGGRTCGVQLGYGLGWDINSSGGSGTGLISTSSGVGNFASRLATDVLGCPLVIGSGAIGTVSSITQSGHIITVATSAVASTPFIGEQITIAGSSNPTLNGTFQVPQGATGLSTTAFTLYSPLSQTASNPVTPGTAQESVTDYDALSGRGWQPYDVITTMLSINDLSQSPATEAAAFTTWYGQVRNGIPTTISSISQSGNVISVTLTSSPGFTPIPGQFFPLSGNATQALNGSFEICAASSATSFCMLSPNSLTIASDPSPGSFTVPGNPNAIICLLGTVINPNNWGSASTYEANETAIAASVAVTTAADSKFFFIPVSSILNPTTGAYAPFFSGGGNAGFSTGTGSNVVGNESMLWSDVTHPDDLGADMYGRMFAEYWRTVILPALK